MYLSPGVLECAFEALYPYGPLSRPYPHHYPTSIPGPLSRRGLNARSNCRPSSTASLPVSSASLPQRSRAASSTRAGGSVRPRRTHPTCTTSGPTQSSEIQGSHCDRALERLREAPSSSLGRCSTRRSFARSAWPSRGTSCRCPDRSPRSSWPVNRSSCAGATAGGISPRW
jgi:hypothetical protein